MVPQIQSIIPVLVLIIAALAVQVVRTRKHNS
jgi:hypothetical protein